MEGKANENTNSRKSTKQDKFEQITEALEELKMRVGPHFRRAEVRNRALLFLEGLMAPVERKNGWQLAKAMGEMGPRGVLRLLGDADWDEEALRDELRRYNVLLENKLKLLGENGPWQPLVVRVHSLPAIVYRLCEGWGKVGEYKDSCKNGPFRQELFFLGCYRS